MGSVASIYIMTIYLRHYAGVVRNFVAVLRGREENYKPKHLRDNDTNVAAICWSKVIQGPLYKFATAS